MGSRRYLTRKVVHALATLLFVLTFNFFLFRVMPSDPVAILSRAQRLTPEDQARQRAELGLDKPIPAQYIDYLGDTVTGNLGVSLRSGIPVMEEIVDKLWPTVLLVGTATLFSTVLGLWVGIRGGWRRGSAFDSSSLMVSLILYSMPEGWLGMILLIVFSGVLGVFPAGHYVSAEGLTGIAYVVDVANHLFLPALTLTLGYIGEYAIFMRSSLLEVKEEDYVLTARAKGLPDREVRRRHAIPNALLPTFTIVFYSFGFILGGSVIIEAVYSWPGLGSLTFDAIGELDYPVLQGIFLVFSVAVIFFNLLADIGYMYIDPRIREA